MVPHLLSNDLIPFGERERERATVSVSFKQFFFVLSCTDNKQLNFAFPFLNNKFKFWNKIDNVLTRVGLCCAILVLYPTAEEGDSAEIIRSSNGEHLELGRVILGTVYVGQPTRVRDVCQ